MTPQEKAIIESKRVLGAKFIVDKVETLWNPHTYVVGPEAAKWLAKHCHGVTSAENMMTVERIVGTACMHKGCTKRFYEHEYKNMLYIRLRIDIPYHAAQSRLKALEEVLKANGLDGYELKKTEYQILPRKVKVK